MIRYPSINIRGVARSLYAKCNYSCSYCVAKKLGYIGENNDFEYNKRVKSILNFYDNKILLAISSVGETCNSPNLIKLIDEFDKNQLILILTNGSNIDLIKNISEKYSNVKFQITHIATKSEKYKNNHLSINQPELSELKRNYGVVFKLLIDFNYDNYDYIFNTDLYDEHSLLYDNYSKNDIKNSELYNYLKQNKSKVKYITNKTNFIFGNKLSCLTDLLKVDNLECLDYSKFNNNNIFSSLLFLFDKTYSNCIRSNIFCSEIDLANDELIKLSNEYELIANTKNSYLAINSEITSISINKKLPKLPITAFIEPKTFDYCFMSEKYNNIYRKNIVEKTKYLTLDKLKLNSDSIQYVNLYENELFKVILCGTGIDFNLLLRSPDSYNLIGEYPTKLFKYSLNFIREN